ETALQAVLVGERLLQRAQLLGCAQRLDGLHRPSVRLDPEHQARPRGQPVHKDCAGATYPVLAAHVRTGVAEVMTQHIGERAAGLNGKLVMGAVHRDPDRTGICHRLSLLPSGPPPAAAIAARTSAGRTGMRSTTAPTWASASLTAFST